MDPILKLVFYVHMDPFEHIRLMVALCIDMILLSNFGSKIECPGRFKDFASFFSEKLLERLMVLLRPSTISRYIAFKIGSEKTTTQQQAKFNKEKEMTFG